MQCKTGGFFRLGGNPAAGVREGAGLCKKFVYFSVYTNGKMLV